MGTNFYAKVNVCPHCHRPEKTLHIGKRSGGWEFSFRGYICDVLEYNEAGRIIRSCEDWEKFLSEPGIVIEDEYGAEYDAETFFKEEVLETRRRGALNHYDYCFNEARKADYLPPSNEYLNKCWKDEFGWSFSDWEFS